MPEAKIIYDTSKKVDLKEVIQAVFGLPFDQLVSDMASNKDGKYSSLYGTDIHQDVG